MAKKKKRGHGNEKKPLVAEGLTPMPTELPGWERETVLAALKSILPDRGAPKGGTHAPGP